MIKIVEKPSRDLKKWAIDLVVDNMKVFNKTSLLRHAKSKSIYNPENTFVVSFTDDTSQVKPNGFITLRIFSEVLYIYEIHVEKNSQGQGIGTKLLEFVKDTFNVSLFILYVYKVNKKAIKFYKTNGFEINKSAKCDIKYFEMISKK